MTEQRMTAGAQKAFEKFTYEWQQPRADAFSWAGAQQAVKQRPDLCERALIKIGRQKNPRDSYRLKSQ